VLVVLASRPGELVTREELRQAIWGNDTVVDFEHGLNTCIRLIRTALGEKADSAEIIETVPRLGYRFKIVPEPGRVTHHRLRWAVAAGLAALAVAVDGATYGRASAAGGAAFCHQRDAARHCHAGGGTG
jgi:hypothetical protein